MGWEVVRQVRGSNTKGSIASGFGPLHPGGGHEEAPRGSANPLRNYTEEMKS